MCIIFQVLGSHQNVFTTKLVEGLALSQQHTKILSLDEFPTGECVSNCAHVWPIVVVCIFVVSVLCTVPCVLHVVAGA